MAGLSRNCLADPTITSNSVRGFAFGYHLLGVWLGFVSFLTAVNLRAAAPELDHFFPIVVRPGTTNVVSALGKLAPWPADFWSEESGLKVRVQTNSGSIEVITDAALKDGPRFLRAYNPSGASQPRMLLVDRREHLLEQEPNDDSRRAQSIGTFPGRIQGRLEKDGDVDWFKLKVEKGRTLVASLQAYVLGSPLDPVLRLVDEHGFQLAVNHDDGRTLDPLLHWTAPWSGTVFLQVFGFKYPADSSVRFSGDSKSVYRLEVSDTVWVDHLMPLGLQTNGVMEAALSGWNLEKADGRVRLELDRLRMRERGRVEIEIPSASNAILVPVGAGPELSESAASNAPSQIPFAGTGCLVAAGEEDRWKFFAKKGERLILEAQSSVLGFPLDPWLKIFDEAGKQLVHNDDADSADPRVEWTPPSDGVFVAVVGGVLNRGGPDHLYRLSVEQAIPGLRLSVADHQLVVEAGKTNGIKITTTRLHGFTNKVELRMQGERPGILAKPVEVPEKGGEVELKFVAAPEASPSSGELRIDGLESDGGRVHAARFWMTTTGVNNGVPNGYHTLLLESTDRLWLTVAKPATNAAEKPKP